MYISEELVLEVITNKRSKRIYEIIGKFKIIVSTNEYT